MTAIFARAYDYFFEKEYDYDAAAAVDTVDDTQNLFSSVADAFSSIAKLPKKISRVLNGKTFARANGGIGIALAIISIPVTIKYLKDSVSSFKEAVKEKDKEFIFDHGVDTIQYAGYLAWIPAAIATGIAALTPISQTALQWVPILNIGLTVISGISAIKNTINVFQIGSKRHKFNKLMVGSTDEKFLNLRAFIVNESAMSVMKNFSVEKDWLLENLDAVDAQDSMQKKERAIKLVQGSIRNTMITNIFYAATNYLTVAGGVTSLIPPAMIASPFLYVGAAAMSLTSDIFGWATWRSFKNSMEKLAEL